MVEAGVLPKYAVSLALAFVLVGCGHKEKAGGQCKATGYPSGESPLVLGLAGAPMELFGSATAPSFDQAFTTLAADGFDVFMPVFISSESASGVDSSQHMLYFVPTGQAQSCVSAYNPYVAARGKLQILFPAFLMVPAEQVNVPMDVATVAQNLAFFVSECLSGDESILAGWQNFDEPASHWPPTFAAQMGLDPQNAAHGFVLPENVEALATLLHQGSTRPVFLIEGVLPFVLNYYPGMAGAPLNRSAIGTEFWATVDRLAPTADWFGFDIYPVPKVEDLSVVGAWTRDAVARAPGKKILAALQGFGEDDLDNPENTGRRPTWQETRFMAYDALINGATSIFWWGQSAVESTSQLWQDLRATAAEVEALGPILAMEVAQASSSDAAIELLARKRGATSYVVLANTALSHVQSSITVTGEWGNAVVTELATGNVVAASTNNGRVAFDVELDRYGVGAYALQECSE